MVFIIKQNYELSTHQQLQGAQGKKKEEFLKEIVEVGKDLGFVKI